MGDYLWDRTGAPDPEVERLEDLLGSLAHRPRPLELPAEVEAKPRPAWRAARLAAAAALLLAVPAGALVAFRQARPDAGSVAESTPPRQSPAPSEAAPPREDLPTPAPTPGRREQAARGGGRRAVRIAGASHGPERSRRGPAAVKAGAVPRLEVAAAPGEAERLQAKEQLVYALRLTSAKLGEVRRKVQGGEDEPGTAPEGRGRTR